jgi:hypothetical protein
MNWRYGSSGKVLALQVGSTEFKLNPSIKKKKEKRRYFERVHAHVTCTIVCYSILLLLLIVSYCTSFVNKDLSFLTCMYV